MKLILTLLSSIILGAGVVSAASSPYPLKTCIVTDSKLGSMGTIVTKVYEGQEIKFCCRPCVKKFDKQPAKFVAQLKAPQKK
jgi:YHS domain-containing protein